MNADTTSSTLEANWTPTEKRIAAAIRAQGGDVTVTVKNGRRLFAAHYPAKAQRLAVRGVPVAVGIE